MTLAPSRELGPRLQLLRDESWTVTYELPHVCCVPGCLMLPEPGGHHIEPRSRTGGPQDFVVIDGVVVANKTRLCSVHHNMVTGGIGGHRAKIVWESMHVIEYVDDWAHDVHEREEWSKSGWLWLERVDDVWRPVGFLKEVVW